jgi:DNA-binding LacI/PurR family transcriptional regulator
MKKATSKKGKVGLREIAFTANVSVATASRVLSGNTRVARDIQKVVLEEAKKLGIDPAQRNKTKTLAFLLSNRAMLHAFHSRILSGAEAHCAANDDIQGGHDATRYLISLGHRHIWFVGNTRLPWFARCFAGYRRAMEENGLPARESSTDTEDETESGYLGTKFLLARDESVTAILAGNDPTAHGVYKALPDRGLKVPDDVSVAGCDDTVGMWLSPALSTTREFPEQLGKQLVELVLKRIAKLEQGPQCVMIPTEFIKRDSCGPPRASRTERVSKGPATGHNHMIEK